MTKINKEKETLLPVALLKELLRYEHETGLFYWIKKPHPKASIKVGHSAGSVSNDGYVRIQINGRSYQAHRLAWAYVHGDYPSGEQPFIDHMNGKRNDNRIANLKVISHGENQRNKRMLSSNTSTTTGIGRYERVWASGRIYACWRATWYDENGKCRQKDFSISTYGEHGAKQMAIEYRAEQIRLLDNGFGIKYTERHGTDR